MNLANTPYAGLPPRPRGYRWFIRVPGSFDSASAFFDELQAAVYAEPTRRNARPADWRPVMERVVRRFYA